MKKLRVAAYTAAALALGSGLISLYWAFGGMVGVDTVGGPIEELITTQNTLARLIALATAVIKFMGVAFALMFIQSWGKRLPSRFTIPLCYIVGGFLTLYGLLNVFVGGMVLAGFIQAQGADLYALKWHVYFWDAYFAVWGIALLFVAYYARKTRRQLG